MKLSDLTDTETKVWQAAATGTLVDLRVGDSQLELPREVGRMGERANRTGRGNRGPSHWRRRRGLRCRQGCAPARSAHHGRSQPRGHHAAVPTRAPQLFLRERYQSQRGHSGVGALQRITCPSRSRMATPDPRRPPARTRASASRVGSRCLVPTSAANSAAREASSPTLAAAPSRLLASPLTETWSAIGGFRPAARYACSALTSVACSPAQGATSPTLAAPQSPLTGSASTATCCAVRGFRPAARYACSGHTSAACSTVRGATSPTQAVAPSTPTGSTSTAACSVARGSQPPARYA